MTRGLCKMISSRRSMLTSLELTWYMLIGHLALVHDLKCYPQDYQKQWHKKKRPECRSDSSCLFLHRSCPLSRSRIQLLSRECFEWWHIASCKICLIDAREAYYQMGGHGQIIVNAVAKTFASPSPESIHMSFRPTPSLSKAEQEVGSHLVFCTDNQNMTRPLLDRGDHGM